MHNGHRKRFKDRLISLSPEVFFEHELLEFLLFFAIPRINTNEIAHRLIKRFGTFEAVFDASVKGIENSIGR